MAPLSDARTLTNLGNALFREGRLDEAARHYASAIQLDSACVEAHNNLGFAFQSQGRLEDAVISYRRALALAPGLVATHANLGTALKELGRFDEAAACFEHLVSLTPDSAEAHNNLGSVRNDQGRPDEAIAHFREALRLNPALAEAHNNLGYALKDRGRFGDAVACFERALELAPDLADAHLNLGNALNDQGYLDEAVARYRRALALKPDAKAHSNLLLTLQYRADVTPRELAEAHAEYERLYAAPLRSEWMPHANNRDPDRRLRLGFVSPDLRRHPVGNYVIRPLESIDTAQAEVVCYSDCATPDDLTARFRAASSLWRDTFGWSDAQLTQQIRTDQIDILIDLAGHTAKNRLLVFARKPAPVQVTWAGYEGTTGLAAMDYLLADRYLTPSSGADVLRLPDGYICYDPPTDAPVVGLPPALRRGAVTFGSFNNPAKITETVVATWSDILRRVPNARLVLKYSGLDDPAGSGRLAASFAARSFEPPRIEFRGWSPYTDMLAQYGEIDIALDTFPFTGGATTCEALWMGAPVVTLVGETFAGRHGLTHLSNVGLTETIANTPTEYVELAASLAADLPRLASLRAGLRAWVASSPLCDGRRFAAAWLAVLRQAWRDSVS